MNSNYIYALALACVVGVTGACSAIRTIEECEFSCTDCKEVKFRCPTDSKSVDVGVPDIAIPKP
jgi:hypothetical protein